MKKIGYLSVANRWKNNIVRPVLEGIRSQKVMGV